MIHNTEIKLNLLLPVKVKNCIFEIEIDFFLSLLKLIEILIIFIKFRMYRVLTMIQPNIKLFRTLNLTTKDFFLSKGLKKIH